MLKHRRRRAQTADEVQSGAGEVQSGADEGKPGEGAGEDVILEQTWSKSIDFEDDVFEFEDGVLDFEDVVLKLEDAVHYVSFDLPRQP